MQIRNVLRRPTVALLCAAVGMAMFPRTADAQGQIGFNAVGTYAWVSGAYGDVLDGGLGGEGSVFYGKGPLGFGLGGSYYSIKMNEPNSDQTWSRVNIFGLFRYGVPSAGRLRPHVSLRVGWAEFSPDAQLNVEKASGWNLGLVLGTEIAMSEKLSFDVSGLFENFNVSDVDLTGGNVNTVSWGWLWGLRAGFTVRP